MKINILSKLYRRLRIFLSLFKVMKYLLIRSKSYERPINPLGSFISQEEIEMAQITNIPAPLLNIFSCVEINVPCQRRGGTGDGSYIMAECDFQNSLLISGGISNNNDFEYECAVLGATGLQFDGSIDFPPQSHPRLGFQKVYVGKTSGYLNLQKMIDKALDFTKSAPSSMILKVDIEGSEWDLLSNEDLRVFDQIIIEIHGLFEVVRKNDNEKLRVLQNLTDNFHTIYANGNKCCGFTNIGGFPIPNVAEFSLVNKRKYTRNGNYNLKPIPISNIQGKPPLQLWGL